jgi:hypothetical protein
VIGQFRGLGWLVSIAWAAAEPPFVGDLDLDLDLGLESTK